MAPKAPYMAYAAEHGVVHHLFPVRYGTTKNWTRSWVTLDIYSILGGNETLESLSDLALDREYLFGIPTFLHSGWFKEGLSPN